MTTRTIDTSTVEKRKAAMRRLLKSHPATWGDSVKITPATTLRPRRYEAEFGGYMVVFNEIKSQYVYAGEYKPGSKVF